MVIEKKSTVKEMNKLFYLHEGNSISQRNWKVLWVNIGTSTRIIFNKYSFIYFKI